MKRYINIFLVTGTYIATLIGAGFASGQEILSFFIKYGNISIFGIIGVSILFGLTAYAILNKCAQLKTSGFREYLSCIVPKPFDGLIEIIIFLFMMTVFGTMAAGCGSALNQMYGIHTMTGVLTICILCTICFMFDIRALLVVNGIIAPIIIIGIIAVCFNVLVYRETAVFGSISDILADNWAVSGLSYASYNILTAVVILSDASNKITNKKDAKIVGILSGGFFLCIMVLVWAVISIYCGKIPLGEIPMLTIVSRLGKAWQVMYTVIFMLAILSTALSNGFGITEKITVLTGVNRNIIGLAVGAAGFLGAGIGFEKLVGDGYNMCGYIGMILLAMILRDSAKDFLSYIKTKK